MNSNNQIIPPINSTEDNGIGIYMTPSLSLSTTNMSTFKTTTTINPLPSKPSEVKRRSNNRKQIYAAINLNNNSSKILENESTIPPPPPPFPENFDVINKIEQKTVFKPIKAEAMNDFQIQIEQAKTRLKKIDTETSSKSNEMIKSIPQNPSSHYRPLELKNIIIEELTLVNGFPPPPSPSTLRRSLAPSVIDPRLDMNFSSVIAQRAAAAKARRHENPIGYEYNLNKFPPSTTFFNNCITTNGIQSNSK
jgi:hypothetical protein